MIKRQAGFTLVELIVTMAIFVITIAAVSAIFVPLLNQFKQQSKIAETNIEGMVGLEILRHDIEHAGFGLPWVLQPGLTTASYPEASAATTAPIPAPSTYNDGNPNLNPPRAILSDDNVLNGSDYLVIKSTAIGINDAAGKYTDVIGTAGGGTTVKSWGSLADDLNTNDRTIVLILSRGENNQRILVNNGSAYTAPFAGGINNFPAAYSPGTEGDLFLIYGITNDTTLANLRMPFNRADYYIRRVAGTTIPARCAKGTSAATDTGVLMKSVIEQASGNRGNGIPLNGIPLIDCVADLQVAFDLDTSDPPDGIVDSTAEDLTGALVTTAEQTRERVKAVRVYILAHEGQKDMNFTYPNPSICVGEGALCIPGNIYDLTAITDYTRYRWRVYTLVVQTKNLMN